MIAWRYLDGANLVTMGGLTAGWGCALLALSGRISAAAALLVMAGLGDLFDGKLRGSKNPNHEPAAANLFPFGRQGTAPQPFFAAEPMPR